MGFFWAVVAGIIASALFSGLAAFYGVWLGRNKYYEEKLWDKKLDAYTLLTEHIHNTNNMLDAFLDSPTIPIFIDMKSELKRLKKTLFFSHLVISDEAYDYVWRIISEISSGLALYNSDGSTSHLFSVHGSDITEIHKLNELARQDLEITKPKSFWKRF